MRTRAHTRTAWYGRCGRYGKPNVYAGRRLPTLLPYLFGMWRLSVSQTGTAISGSDRN